MAEPYVEQVEYLDVLTKIGKKIGKKIGGSKPRGDVHRNGDYHKAVHVWIFTESTQELLLQKRADCKDSWPGLWDISSAGHISAGDSSLITAHPKYVPYDVNKQYGLVFDIITKRYKENNEARSLILQKQLRRYAPVSLTAEVVNFLQF
ncbi:hypothetical protein ES332_1Z015100v1 [Gossypium tomentosum]|uniref:Nudix hydrolase domain-containing protein n=1 Tax=Gossypium tomentosum TaxID=34277 RepID=A0A5C7J1E2_GOSTO|nr:hypothetical protein ES332_1Z015100v1 [Gossypium tomentosum]